MAESVGVSLRVWGCDPRGLNPTAAVAAEADEEENVGADGCRRCRPTVLPVWADVVDGGRLLSPAATAVAVASTRVEATPPPEESS